MEGLGRASSMKKESFYIIDGSSCLFRAFHAIPHLSNSRGLPTNAIYGFAQTLRRIVRDHNPDYILVAFDARGPSYRHEIFEEYKAERAPMPEELGVQIPYVKEITRAFGISLLEREGFEADDIIATLVQRLRGKDLRIVVVTGDKDMFQLVDGDVVIYDHAKNREYTAEDVKERFGVAPAYIADLIALAGDPSDNIPGVPGIGPKTAARLIEEFGTVEGIYRNLDKLPTRALKERLQRHRDSAFLSKRLATLSADMPLDIHIKALRYHGPDVERLEPILKELEFSRLLKEMVPDNAPGKKTHYSTVSTGRELRRLKEHLLSLERISVTVETDGKELLGIAIGTEKSAFYIPIRGFYFTAGVEKDDVVRELGDVMADGRIKKICDDSKALVIAFKRLNSMVKGVDMDTSIASYLLNPSKPGHTIEDVAYEYLDTRLEGRVKKGMTLEEASTVSCAKASTLYTLYRVLYDRLKENGLLSLFYDLELPLVEVLADMEIWGIKVDRERLRDLSKELERELTTIRQRIYTMVGVEFNINSPKQLSEVLFKRLGLKPVRRTKTGLSTDEGVLTVLALQHEVPQHIMNFRQLSKFKSTYVDSLLELINPETGRVHTSFNQTVTATGRLSSSKPNLQNIPIRNGFGRRIREAFVAEKGFVLLCADYSQIELRLVAHLSGDPVLIDAFRRDEDIHTRTASELFGTIPGLVTPEMRRRAKVINFGIIYGMGPYGLSEELGISVEEAKDYIERYFSHYRKVKEFITYTVEEARKKGYTTTIFGRRRYIPELQSPSEKTQRLGERMAINTPVQGSAADIIKASMIKIHSRFTKEGLGSRMILQIHDELVFEVAEDERERVGELVREEMEGIVELSVPVKVNMKSGYNWLSVE